MNEFGAKKLGEVLAFSQAGQEIMRKGKKALDNIFENTSKISGKFLDQEGQILKLAEKLSTIEITTVKARKTKEKLLKMAQLYIGQEWDNPAELMEWMGFFEGAAIVHWKLVEGVGNKLSDSELSSLAIDAIVFHQKLLDWVGENIYEHAKSKA